MARSFKDILSDALKIGLKGTPAKVPTPTTNTKTLTGLISSTAAKAPTPTLGITPTSVSPTAPAKSTFSDILTNMVKIGVEGPPSIPTGISLQGGSTPTPTTPTPTTTPTPAPSAAPAPAPITTPTLEELLSINNKDWQDKFDTLTGQTDSTIASLRGEIDASKSARTFGSMLGGAGFLTGMQIKQGSDKETDANKAKKVKDTKLGAKRLRIKLENDGVTPNTSAMSIETGGAGFAT